MHGLEKTIILSLVAQISGHIQHNTAPSRFLSPGPRSRHLTLQTIQKIRPVDIDSKTKIQ